VLDPMGSAAYRQIHVYSIALFPAALIPTVVGLANILYFIGALVVSIGFLILAIHLFRERSVKSARQLFLGSLIFLSLIFFLLMLA
jgi:protoheme IX farnesyltransferase